LNNELAKGIESMPLTILQSKLIHAIRYIGQLHQVDANILVLICISMPLSSGGKKLEFGM
jgi:hypothetical protein